METFENPCEKDICPRDLKSRMYMREDYKCVTIDLLPV